MTKPGRPRQYTEEEAKERQNERMRKVMRAAYQRKKAMKIFSVYPLLEAFN